jgi:hypothetical protein
MRLKDDIDTKKLKGIFRAYPLLDDNKKILWPQKFKNDAAIKKLHNSIADEDSWNREYLLKIQPTETHKIICFGKNDLLYLHMMKLQEPEEKKRFAVKRLGQLRGYSISAPTIDTKQKNEFVFV